jgi:proteasome accessory factor A
LASHFYLAGWDLQRRSVPYDGTKEADMSIPKVVGIEQEYAIQLKGDPSVSAFDASCMLVNAYARKVGLREPGMRMLWDYAHETPYEDIRGRLFRKSPKQQVVHDDDNVRINAGLPNGARFYTDHAHPEYSTAECRSALQALACDKSGEIVLRSAVSEVRALCPEVGILLYKNNSDHKGHSYGCHENYLMDAGAHEAAVARESRLAAKVLIPFLVTRQVFAGAGKVGSEAPHSRGAVYQVSQRSDFMENLYGLETMYARPIINTRAEHHADARRFRRLHLIVGDANMCEVAGFLKLGTTQIVLQMMEDRFITDDWTLRQPLQALHGISMDYTDVIELADGNRRTAVQIQRRFLEKAKDFKHTPGAEAIPHYERILTLWEEVLEGLDQLKLSKACDIEDDPAGLVHRLDWLLKLWLLNRYRQKQSCAWDHPLLSVLDLQYHRIDSGDGLFYRLQSDHMADRLLDDGEIDHYVDHAPDDTRAYFRSRCIQRYARQVYLLNWEVIGFDHGEAHRMVPLLNPLKGTRQQFESVFAKARDSNDLISRLEDASA